MSDYLLPRPKSEPNVIQNQRYFFLYETKNPTIYNMIHWFTCLLGQILVDQASDVRSIIFFSKFCKNLLNLFLNVLKSPASEICIKQIQVKQGVEIQQSTIQYTAHC